MFIAVVCGRDEIYDDGWNPIAYFQSKAGAQKFIDDRCLEKNKEIYVSDRVYAMLKEWDMLNPVDVDFLNSPPKPVFDQDRKHDKEYNKEHVARIEEWRQILEPFNEYDKMRNQKRSAYAKEIRETTEDFFDRGIRPLYEPDDSYAKQYKIVIEEVLP